MKYRILEPGETLRNGDELRLQQVKGFLKDAEQEWVKTKYPGKRVDGVLTYRRPVPEATHSCGYDTLKYHRPVPEKPTDHRHVWIVELQIGGQWQPFEMRDKRSAARLKARVTRRGCLKTRIRKYVPEEVTV